MFRKVNMDTRNYHAKGCEARFIKKKYRRPAMKFYCTINIALQAYFYQYVAHMNGIGPKPGILVKSMDGWYGFTTEQVIANRPSTESIAYSELYNQLKQLGYDTSDLHSGNIGWKNRQKRKRRRLVCLDFDPYNSSYDYARNTKSNCG